MRSLPAIAASVTIAATPALGDSVRTALVVHVSPAVVELAALGTGRIALQLPGLEFPLLIEPSCPPGSDLASLSVNVADTRYRFTADDIDEAGTLETTIVVPAVQLAPLPIENSCTSTDAPGMQNVRVEDVLTANASLRCANESGETLLFEAISLGVELRCPTEPVETEAVTGASELLR